MPPKPKKHLTIPYPAHETMQIVRRFASIQGLDEQTSAEHLIAYGARAWLDKRKAGKAAQAAADPKARSERWTAILEAYWIRRRAARAEKRAALVAECIAAGKTPPKERAPRPRKWPKAPRHEL